MNLFWLENQVVPTSEVIEGADRIWCIDISPDNKITAVGFARGNMILYNTVTGKMTFQDDRHGSSNLNVRFSKGKIIFKHFTTMLPKSAIGILGGK